VRGIGDGEPQGPDLGVVGDQMLANMNADPVQARGDAGQAADHGRAGGLVTGSEADVVSQPSRTR
jgi:hypothetical protein